MAEVDDDTITPERAQSFISWILSIETLEENVISQLKLVAEGEESNGSVLESAKAFIIDEMLSRITKPGGDKRLNQSSNDLGMTYATAFECFTAAFIFALYSYQRNAKLYKVEVCNKPKEGGIDVKVFMIDPRRSEDEMSILKEIVLTKCGETYFGDGKGNDIVSAIDVSCSNNNVSTGIIVSSEERSALTQPTKDIVESLRNKGRQIFFYFIDDIKSKINDFNPTQVVVFLEKYIEYAKEIH